MKQRALLIASLFALLPMYAQAELYISVIQGLGGNDQYSEQFDEQREQIAAAAQTLTTADRIMIFSGEDARREKLLEHFAALNNTMADSDRAAIFLIGHGSFDGFDYKFNLPGLDITGDDLKQILADLPGRNHFLINTSSTSGAMLDTITGAPDSQETDGNILVAATRTGNERNATHFGRFFAEALTNEEADLNKNNNVSVQEAFDYAVRGVESYFENEGRIVTEHGQLRGEGAAAFSLSRLAELEYSNDEPEINALLQERLALDNQIEELQLRRREYTNAEYVERLRNLVLQSAQLTERIEALQGGNQDVEE